jgi:hypothetical protein
MLQAEVEFCSRYLAYLAGIEALAEQAADGPQHVVYCRAGARGLTRHRQSQPAHVRQGA